MYVSRIYRYVLLKLRGVVNGDFYPVNYFRNIEEGVTEVILCK